MKKSARTLLRDPLAERYAGGVAHLLGQRDLALDGNGRAHFLLRITFNKK
jgi:hypothetical protein